MRSPPPSKKPEHPDTARGTPGVRAQALRLLARREHTRAELRERLEVQGADAAEIEAVLDEFSRCGWISDTRVAEQITHTRRSRFGSARIRQELAKKGVPGDVIDAAMPALKDGDIEAARAIWRRKFRAPPLNAAERARQLRFLQSRGFTLELAMRVLREAVENEGRRED